MTNFNKKQSTSPNATTYENGSGYTKDVAENWLNFLFSCYLEDRFYETGSKQLNRFLALTDDMINKYGAEFAAKASFFARNELGMRSVAQMVAGILNNYQFYNKRAYYCNFCHRPDDVAEVFAAVEMLQNKRSHAMVRGFKDYLSKLNTYSLGKYKLANHKFNMYDCINITHANSPAIDAYKKEILETPDTWETSISASTTQEEKEQNWMRLVEEHKLGYLALIRNLRNILNCEKVDYRWIADNLLPQLMDEKTIIKSLVFPYQIYTAYKNMGFLNPVVVAALEKAFLISIENMPKLSGTNLIMLDVSGSMDDPISAHSTITIKEAGAVYAAILCLQSEKSQIIKFGSTGCTYKFHKNNNIFEEIKNISANSGCGYATYVQAAYGLVDQHYDRIFIISDMQVMDCWRRTYYDSKSLKCYKDYCKKYGISPIYSFDLGNYSVQLDNPDNPNVHLCTSLSEKTLKFIQFLEDGDNLVNYINTHYDYS